MVIYMLGTVNCSLTRLILVFPNMGDLQLTFKIEYPVL